MRQKSINIPKHPNTFTFAVSELSFIKFKYIHIYIQILLKSIRTHRNIRWILMGDAFFIFSIKLTLEAVQFLNNESVNK